MKNRKLIIGIMMLLPAVAISLIPAGSWKRYIVDAYLVLILVMVHVFMPGLAGLDSDHPKVKTLRRYNVLMGLIVAALRVADLARPERNMADDSPWILPMAVMVILLVGNAAPKLPVNHVIGIRMPWTMRDQDTWRMTHRMLGYCSFPVALVTLAGGLLIDRVVFSVGGLLAFALIPSVYSYFYYRCRK